MVDVKKEALKINEENAGKIEVNSTVPIDNMEE